MIGGINPATPMGKFRIALMVIFLLACVVVACVAVCVYTPLGGIICDRTDDIVNHGIPALLSKCNVFKSDHKASKPPEGLPLHPLSGLCTGGNVPDPLSSSTSNHEPGTSLPPSDL